MADEKQRHQRQQQQIQPGQCPPEGCPEPDRIECIVVDKVYDSCFQVHDLTRQTDISVGPYMDFEKGPFEINDRIKCKLRDVITCTEIDRQPTTEEGFFTITLSVTVPLTLINPNDKNETVDRDFMFTKTVTLCCPEGVEPDCTESTLLNCVCVITDEKDKKDKDKKKDLDSESHGYGYCGEIEVTCDLQICLVVKCILNVQLLVPSYGFCVPAPCITVPGICPPLPPEQCF